MNPVSMHLAARAALVGMTLTMTVTAACSGPTDANAEEAVAASTSAVTSALVFAGWQEVPGGGSTPLADAAVVFNSRIYLFGIGNDNRHYVNSFDGASWTGWGQVFGGGSTPLPDTAVVFHDRLYLFGIGNDHADYVNVFDGASWTGWAPVPGGGSTLLPDSAVTFQDRLYLFSIGQDHKHYVNVFDGTTWTGWQLVPGGGTTRDADTSTVLNGRLYLFAVGGGDRRHYVNSFDGTTWTGWARVPGDSTSVTSTSAITHEGKIYLFAIGDYDHAHYQNVYDGSAWTGWRILTGNGMTNLADSVVSYAGRLYLFGIGTDHAHYVNVAAAPTGGICWSCIILTLPPAEQPIVGIAGFDDSSGTVPWLQNAYVATHDFVKRLGYRRTDRWHSVSSLRYAPATSIVAFSAHRTYDNWLHSITAESNGDIVETYHKYDGSASHTRLATLPGASGLASFYAPNDDRQHAFVAAGQQVHEIYWQPTVGVTVNPGYLTFDQPIVAIAGEYIAAGQLVVVALANGEVWVSIVPSTQSRTQPPSKARLGLDAAHPYTFPDGIAGIAVALDSTFSLYVADTHGAIVYFRPGTNGVIQASATIGHVNGAIAGIAAYSKGNQPYVLVAKRDGEIREIESEYDGTYQDVKIAGVDPASFGQVDEACLPGGDSYVDIATFSAQSIGNFLARLTWKVVRGGPAGSGTVVVDGAPIDQYFEAWAQLPASTASRQIAIPAGESWHTLRVDGACGSRQAVAWVSYNIPLPPPPPAPSVTIHESSDYINNGDSTTVSWSTATPAGCGAASVTLTAQRYTAFDWDRQVFFQKHGLPASGAQTLVPTEGTEYLVTAHCQGSAESTPAKANVTLHYPPAPTPDRSWQCFKVQYSTLSLCSTFAYNETSASAAQSRCAQENPTGTVTSIACGQMSSACPSF